MHGAYNPYARSVIAHGPGCRSCSARDMSPPGEEPTVDHQQAIVHDSWIRASAPMAATEVSEAAGVGSGLS